MKQVIEYLRSKGINVTDEGIILSELPVDLEGLDLINAVEDIETEDGEIYTINNDRIEAA